MTLVIYYICACTVYEKSFRCLIISMFGIVIEKKNYCAISLNIFSGPNQVKLCIFFCARVRMQVGECFSVIQLLLLIR